MTFDSDFDLTIISLDCFYKGLDKSVVDVKDYNFDHPDALDFDLAYEVTISINILGTAKFTFWETCLDTWIWFLYPLKKGVDHYCNALYDYIFWRDFSTTWRENT